MQGWIKLHRKLLASDVFQNEKLLKVFIYCLLKATHSEISQKVGRQTVELKPGQFIYGRKKAALELNMKESTVRDYINILKDDGVITVNPTNKYSVITVVNWDLYQSKEETPDNKYDSTSDNKPTTEGQQKDTNKNEKNDKNDKNNNYTSKIKDLLTVYSKQIPDFVKLNKDYWDVIRETRTTGKVSESVIYKTMKKWARFDPAVIQYALKAHIEAHAGKREEYTIGIMRNTSKEEAKDRLNRKVADLNQYRNKKLNEIDWEAL